MHVKGEVACFMKDSSRPMSTCVLIDFEQMQVLVSGGMRERPWSIITREPDAIFTIKFTVS